MNKSVFNYDQDDNLVSYKELDHSGGTSYSCSLTNNIYTRFYAHNNQKDITIFEEEAKLNFLSANGENWVRAIKVNSQKIEFPKKSFFVSVRDGFVENFRVNKIF